MHQTNCRGGQSFRTKPWSGTNIAKSRRRKCYTQKKLAATLMIEVRDEVSRGQARGVLEVLLLFANAM